MNVIYDLMLLLNAIFFGLSIFIAIILWNQKTTYRPSNRVLSILPIAFAITTFNTIVRLTHYMEAMDFYQDISNSALLLMGPTIFLFLKMRVVHLSKWKVLVHYAPFFLYAIMLLALKLFSIESGKEAIDSVAFLTFVVQWVVYILFSFFLINAYERRTKENLSNLDKHDIGWVRIVLFTLLFTLILRLAVLAYSVLVQKVLDVIGLNLTLVFAVATCYLGYKIFKNPELFVQLPSYIGSKLSAHDLHVNKQKIEAAMGNASLFANPKLTISDLALQAGLHSRQVSQTLNQEMKQNFFDYVNGYRVKALIEKLKSSESTTYTLQALMEDSGFQSPSVAYSAFKKVTGTTPAQYRKRV